MLSHRDIFVCTNVHTHRHILTHIHTYTHTPREWQSSPIAFTKRKSELELWGGDGAQSLVFDKLRATTCVVGSQCLLMSGCLIPLKLIQRWSLVWRLPGATSLEACGWACVWAQILRSLLMCGQFFWGKKNLYRIIG